MWSDVSQIWIVFGQLLPPTGQFRPNLAWDGRSSARTRPRLARVLPKLARRRSTFQKRFGHRTKLASRVEHCSVAVRHEWCSIRATGGVVKGMPAEVAQGALAENVPDNPERPELHRSAAGGSGHEAGVKRQMSLSRLLRPVFEPPSDPQSYDVGGLGQGPF